MSEKTQSPKKPEAKEKKESRVSIISAVKTPLGFFTLGILVVEAIFALLVSQVDGTDRTLLIFGMISALILLFVFVAFLALYRPAALQSGSQTPLSSDAEALLSHVERQRHIGASLVGDWTLVVAPRGGSAEPPMGRQGTCLMRQDSVRLVIDGEWRDEQSGATRNWTADDVFVDQNKLTCIFKIQQDKPGETVVGITQLRLLRDEDAAGQVLQLAGSWALLGENVYGDARLTRPEGPEGPEGPDDKPRPPIEPGSEGPG